MVRMFELLVLTALVGVLFGLWVLRERRKWQALVGHVVLMNCGELSLRGRVESRQGQLLSVTAPTVFGAGEPTVLDGQLLVNVDHVVWFQVVS